MISRLTPLPTLEEVSDEDFSPRDDLLPGSPSLQLTLIPSSIPKLKKNVTDP